MPVKVSSDELPPPDKIFEDIYDKLGNYYVMTKQVVQSNEQGQTKNYEIIFSDINLLG